MTPNTLTSSEFSITALQCVAHYIHANISNLDNPTILVLQHHVRIYCKSIHEKQYGKRLPNLVSSAVCILKYFYAWKIRLRIKPPIQYIDNSSTMIAGFVCDHFQPSSVLLTCVVLYVSVSFFYHPCMILRREKKGIVKLNL